MGCWTAKDWADSRPYNRALSTRMSVSVDPGLTELAVTPVPRSSAARPLTNPTTPALAAL